jgi:hypothetical protein
MATKSSVGVTWRPEPKPKRRTKPAPFNHRKKLGPKSKWRKR